MLRVFEPPYLGAIKDFRSFQIKVWPYIAHQTLAGVQTLVWQDSKLAGEISNTPTGCRKLNNIPDINGDGIN